MLGPDATNKLVVAARAAADSDRAPTLAGALRRARACLEAGPLSDAERARPGAVLAEIGAAMQEQRQAAPCASDDAVDIIKRAIAATESLPGAIRRPGVRKIIWAVQRLGCAAGGGAKLDALLGALTSPRVFSEEASVPPSLPAAMLAWPSIALLWVANNAGDEGAAARLLS